MIFTKKMIPLMKEGLDQVTITVQMYSLSSPKSLTLANNQFFGSTVERFRKLKDQTLGPGKYTINSNFSIAKERMAKNNKEPTTTRMRFKEMNSNDVPGPGQYKETTMSELISKKLSGK
jgi:hypothetical protein